jgi:thiol-disulfide isomerase/thioredoxin
MKTRLIYLFGIVVALLVLLRLIQSSNEGFADAGTNAAATFTLYYADWCPHCKTVKPAFDDWAKNGFVSVAGRNVKVESVESSSPKMQGVKVKGYPTFMLMTADGKNVEYQGDRTPDGYMAFLKESLQGLAKAQQ